MAQDVLHYNQVVMSWSSICQMHINPNFNPRLLFLDLTYLAVMCWKKKINILKKEAWFHNPILSFTVIIWSILQGPLKEKTTLLSGADETKKKMKNKADCIKDLW